MPEQRKAKGKDGKYGRNSPEAKLDTANQCAICRDCLFVSG
jgi:hypothetical protein